jgi:CheY-like chemotaxis protein
MSRILIAEDDPHILRVISLWLARHHHEVREARNGMAALALVVARVPDVLITDVNMPGMDGLQLIERLVGTALEPRGIVVLTNRWDHVEIGDRLARWGVHVLPKPFSPSKLSSLVQSLVSPQAADVHADQSEPGV